MRDTSDACLIFDFGNPRARAADLVRDCVRWSDSTFFKPGGFPIVYGPLVPYIQRSYELALGAMCGGANCPAKQAPIRLVFLKKGLPAAWLFPPAAAHTDVVMSSSFADYALQGNGALSDDLFDRRFTDAIGRGGGQAESRYHGWLERVRATSGKTCDEGAPWPAAPPLSDADSLRSNARAISLVSVIGFVMSHEMAHIEFGPQCGGAQPGLRAEMRCDSVAFARLLRSRKTYPAFPVAALVALGVWESWVGPRIQTYNFQSQQQLLSALPERDWSARSARLIDAWEDYCVSVRDDVTCRAAPEFAAFLRDENTRPKPRPCVEKSSQRPRFGVVDMPLGQLPKDEIE